MLYRLISLVFLFLIYQFINVYGQNVNNFLLPKEKPSIFKKLDAKKNNSKILPKDKPIKSKNEIKDNKLVEGAQKKKEIVRKKEIKKINVIATFILPKSKPEVYKKIETVQKSKILKKKDFEKEKIIFENISKRKWSTALKQNV